MGAKGKHKKEPCAERVEQAERLLARLALRVLLERRMSNGKAECGEAAPPGPGRGGVPQAEYREASRGEPGLHCPSAQPS